MPTTVIAAAGARIATAGSATSHPHHVGRSHGRRTPLTESSMPPCMVAAARVISPMPTNEIRTCQAHSRVVGRPVGYSGGRTMTGSSSDGIQAQEESHIEARPSGSDRSGSVSARMP